MDVRQTYGSNELDKLFVYFMKTVLRLQKRGALHVPVDVKLGEPMDGFLQTIAALMEHAQPPEVFALVLQVEREHIAATHKLTKAHITQLALAQQLALHVRFDPDPSEYLLSLGNLWHNNAPLPGEESAGEYAMKTFYCNLPAQVQKQQGVDTLLARLPEGFLQPDNF